eukprot:CAMPEP_0174277958 /NCGR_PEP_ID=MMETSP0439-20130205/61214_1 /TAXON_ID=0 /ORGANISM="Stereomyxa ramosa, Strain Chinc5" /LENGTH=464 /DNA_ID=CAMNT_0015370323 /DNA_START=120 /DNA_END=1511 /DNA_ORIENTATION=-
MLQPTHNKQAFLHDKNYRLLNNTLKSKLHLYWKAVCPMGTISAFWKELANAPYYLDKVIQCNKCLKWRSVPNDPSSYPDSWECSDNTNPDYNSCEKHPEPKPTIPMIKQSMTQAEKKKKLQQDLLRQEQMHKTKQRKQRNELRKIRARELSDELQKPFPLCMQALKACRDDYAKAANWLFEAERRSERRGKSKESLMPVKTEPITDDAGLYEDDWIDSEDEKEREKERRKEKRKEEQTERIKEKRRTNRENKRKKLDEEIQKKMDTEMEREAAKLQKKEKELEAAKRELRRQKMKEDEARRAQERELEATKRELLRQKRREEVRNKDLEYKARKAKEKEEAQREKERKLRKERESLEREMRRKKEIAEEARKEREALEIEVKRKKEIAEQARRERENLIKEREEAEAAKKALEEERKIFEQEKKKLEKIKEDKDQKRKRDSIEQNGNGPFKKIKLEGEDQFETK